MLGVPDSSFGEIILIPRNPNVTCYGLGGPVQLLQFRGRRLGNRFS